MKSTKKKKEDAIATASSNLPEEILGEIFLKLPAKSVMRFRCVKKSICALFDSSKFKAMHHELRNNTSILFHEANREKLYKIDYMSVSSLLPLSTSSTTKCDHFITQMDYPSIFHDCEVEFLSSCDGLVWMNRDEIYYVWNPATGVCKKVPMAEVDEHYIDGYGFGYDDMTEEYKLVNIVGEGMSFDADVYILGSNRLKRIQNIPYYLYYEQSYFEGVLVNGALHWLANTIRNDLLTITLIGFDIVNERFHEVAMPEVSMPDSIHVGVLGGCLCLVLHLYRVRVDVWIMQDYGVQQSWTKSFTITQDSITRSEYLELIWSFKNNETLWEVDGGLILYDPNNEAYRKLILDSHCRERKTVARDYVVSSVSP